MDFLEYGKIINTHGIRGELKVDVYCDDFIADQIDEVFIDGAKHEIVSVRYHKGFALVTLKDISDLNQAMALKNKLMMFDKACVELPEGEYFIADLIGFDVFDRITQKNIGKLKRVSVLPGLFFVVLNLSRAARRAAFSTKKYGRGIAFCARMEYNRVKGRAPAKRRKL